MTDSPTPPGLSDLHSFGLLDAMLGRRSRRFFMGADIPDGVFQYRSKEPVTPLSEVTAELSTACFSGTLMLEAMGLGGWMFNGLDAFSVLGARGDPEAGGLGFRYDSNDDWPYPNPTGLDGVMEGFCPPHYENMRAAVEAVVERKFGPGGPFHKDTPGPWKNASEVRTAATVHDEKFKECVAFQAQYVYDTFGKFPVTVPSIFVMQYLQVHHIDTDFYDTFYKPGAYGKTHANHMGRWHG